MQILFLIPQSDLVIDGNYRRLANLCQQRGDRVVLAFMESLAMRASAIVVDGMEMSGPLDIDAPFPDHRPCGISSMDTIWVMSLGMQGSFLDKMQMLHCAGPARILNSLESLMHLKSKYFLAADKSVIRHPETHAGNNAAALFDIVAGGGRWIAKPPAGSFGREVYLISRDDPNARVVLDALTGHESGNYCLLQRYVPEIEAGEKRVLIAGGVPVAQYLRRQGMDHRTNVMQGAHIDTCDLTAAERDYCTQIGHMLGAMGADFVGMDLAYPWVIEFNVVNPGGILTIESLTGIDVSPAVLAHAMAT
jgi:glutathione synthase